MWGLVGLLLLLTCVMQGALLNRPKLMAAAVPAGVAVSSSVFFERGTSPDAGTPLDALAVVQLLFGLESQLPATPLVCAPVHTVRLSSQTCGTPLYSRPPPA
jgi:hypothetical protein